MSACGTREETISHWLPLRKIAVLKPAGVPRSVAMLITDNDGWNNSARRLAPHPQPRGRPGHRRAGASFYTELEKEIDGCDFTDGDLENLSHFVQAYYHLPGYTAPVLVGFGEGYRLRLRQSRPRRRKAPSPAR